MWALPPSGTACKHSVLRRAGRFVATHLWFERCGGRTEQCCGAHSSPGRQKTERTSAEEMQPCPNTMDSDHFKLTWRSGPSAGESVSRQMCSIGICWISLSLCMAEFKSSLCCPHYNKLTQRNSQYFLSLQADTSQTSNAPSFFNPGVGTLILFFFNTLELQHHK